MPAGDPIYKFIADDGPQLPLHAGRISLGRQGQGQGQRAELQLDDDGLDDVHLDLFVGAGGIWCQRTDPSETYHLNGRAVRSAALRPGDRLQVGRQGLTLLGPLGGDDKQRRNNEVVHQPDRQASWQKRTTAALECKDFNSLKNQLDILFHLVGLIENVSDIRKLADKICRLATEVLSATSAWCIRFEGSGLPLVLASHGKDGGNVVLPPSSTIIGRVWQQSVSLLTTDAGSDPRLANSWSIMNQGIRTVVCAPIRHAQQLLGVLYADCTDGEREPSADDLAILETIASFAALALHKADLYTAMDDQRRDLHLLVHDMKNPLSVIRYGVDSLSREIQASDSSCCDTVEHLDKACSRLEAFVSDILQVAQMQESALRLQHTAVDLKHLLTEVEKRWQPSMELVGLRIKIDAPESISSVRGDARLIERVLDNLVANARSHAPFESTITLRLAIEPSQWHIAVCDQGPGVSEQLREVIFAKHGRADDPGAAGRGFGLYFCRLAVEAHNGTVWVQGSPGDNQIVFQIPTI